MNLIQKHSLREDSKFASAKVKLLMVQSCGSGSHPNQVAASAIAVTMYTAIITVCFQLLDLKNIIIFAAAPTSGIYEQRVMEDPC